MKNKRLLIAALVLTFAVLSIAVLTFSLKLFNPVGSGNFAEKTPEEITNVEGRLLVYGFVQHPLNLTIQELMDMPRTTVNAELYCVGNPSFAIEKGNWTGVQLKLILERTGVRPEAIKVAFYAKDNYTTDLSVATAEREDIILAYEKDGEPLHEQLCLVVPGKWGYKWINSITRIELVNYDFKGVYESKGYSDEADITPKP